MCFRAYWIHIATVISRTLSIRPRKRIWYRLWCTTEALGRNYWRHVCTQQWTMTTLNLLLIISNRNIQIVDWLPLVYHLVKSWFSNIEIFVWGKKTWILLFQSAGGIQITGYLAKHGTASRVSYAMIISAPYNLRATYDELKKTRNYFMNSWVLDGFKKMFNKYKWWLTSCGNIFSLVIFLWCYYRYRSMYENDERFDCEKIKKAKTIADFEQNFLIKQFGYDSLDSYYNDSNMDTKIHSIQKTTLFLNASDDMFSPESGTRSDQPI